MSPQRILAAVAVLAVGSAGLTACDGSGKGGSPSKSSTSSGAVGSTTAPGSGSPSATSASTKGTSTRSGSGSRTSSGTTTRSGSTSGVRTGPSAPATPSVPTSAPRAWRTYQPLPTSTAIRSGTAMRLISMSFDALDGGWNLRTQYRAPKGTSRGQLIYFALVQSGREGAATPFRLQRTNTFTVFMTGTQTPRPTQVVLYQAGPNNSQGKAVLRASIPAAAFVS